jgi:chemotaxis protein histidine kinase CheA
MEELRDQFRQRSIASLHKLALSMRDDPANLPPALFRTLHTIKGTARTFGLRRAAEFAHGLEDRLSALTKTPPPYDQGPMREGLLTLAAYLESADTSDAADSRPATSGNSPRDIGPSRAYVTLVPLQDLERLSATEKERLLESRATPLFWLRAEFDLSLFTFLFRELKEKLDKDGEVIAVLPRRAAQGRIGFSIYAAMRRELIVFYPDAFQEQTVRPETTDLLQASLLQIAKHAVDLAVDLNKKVDIFISAPVSDTTRKRAALIFDLLIHLVRNAVDHAFVKEGTLLAGITPSDQGLTITVADNGIGIDPEKLAAKAAGLGLAIDGMAPLDLVFLPGLTTAKKTTDISGRGVGLDAVKAMVEDVGGVISVESKKGEGTRFELFLPHKRKRKRK